MTRIRLPVGTERLSIRPLDANDAEELHGYAFEALRAVLDAGFRDLDVDRICAVTHVDNERAHRVLAALGGARLRNIHVYGPEMTLYEFARP